MSKEKRKKKYRVIRDGKFVTTNIPGKYAGSKNLKIFGRLDCPSGKRKMKKKNRVFFRDWDDAVAMGYRPCRVCRPERT